MLKKCLYLIIPLVLICNVLFPSFAAAQQSPGTSAGSSLKNMHFDKQKNAYMCNKYTYWDGKGCSYCPKGQTSIDGKTCLPIECPANMWFNTATNTCQCDAGTTYTTGPGCVYPPDHSSTP